MATEFEEFAKGFEARKYEGQVIPESCMYAVREGPHKTACSHEAQGRSDGYPVCRRHISADVKASWRGYIEGA